MDKFIKISSVTKKKILLKDVNNKPLLIKYEYGFTNVESNKLYDEFLNCKWKTQKIKMVGKWIEQARQTFAYSKSGENLYIFWANNFAC